MRILVTRPLPDADRTADSLRALGHAPIVAPLLRVLFAPPPNDVPLPAAIVATSRNAVRALSGWPQSADWLKLPLFVTGQATSDVARDAGFADVQSGEGDASDLVPLVTAQIGAEAGPILYPAARDRSTTVEARLRGLGYDICLIEAYAAELSSDFDPSVRQAIASSSVHAVLLYSARTATAFRRIVERDGLADGLRGTVLLAISERVAEPLSGLGGEIRVAERPNERDLFALLPSVGC